MTGYDILENKDKWFPVLLAKINEKNDSSMERQAAVAGLDRETLALKKTGKKSDRVTTTAGDYLFMPLYSGVPMAKFDKDKTHFTIVKPSAVFAEVKTSAERLSLIMQLGEQLQALHDKNLTHGDLHPGNMLVSRDNAGIHLHLIDFDQSREIENKKQLLSPGTVNMAPMIRGPEITKNQVGAPSDIYALGLNYLLILGHENPFKQDPTITFIRSKKKEIETTPEFAAEALEKYNALSPADQKKCTLAQFKIRLLNQKLPEAEIQRLWDAESSSKLKIGQLKSIPIEINGIPIRKMVKAFLKSMLSPDPANRPTIDEVNAFMTAVQKMVNDPTHKVDNSADALDRWKDTKSSKLLNDYKGGLLTSTPKPVIVAQVPSRPRATAMHEPDTYREALTTLLKDMLNIDQEIDKNKKKGIIGYFFDKSAERIQFENTLKGIAGLYNAASSNDPKKDYEQIIVRLHEERAKLVSSNSTDKLKALDSVLAKTEKKLREPSFLNENKSVNPNSESTSSLPRRLS